MTPSELLRNEAVKGLHAAQIPLGPSRSVFHSQQAAEMAIKAFLSFHQISFRKTHNLTDLGMLVRGRCN